ncbi:hypothetical protein DOT66_25360 [Ralstonia pseudosolanacearum]|uniref:HNH endonuclease n=2 Tax=Ralstonia pseudosolanacearum TaxID=1310165 RepID=UPI000DAE5E92|nr:HNH endonuclease [Ralstonia pseudosolanacearum]MCK4140627.1 hypothetical protein [Ralstonia pseudosolanacearum]QVX37948.1 HNH endonuclease [Ralstonia solanacearum]RAA04404.1 hypothetical protein DOT66_25360 [Ralstonia pseudosolanacearum]UQY81503.1 HNH endonuclease [Ralstonia pseudosolanacearum]
MENLCSNDDQRIHLQRLKDLIQTKELTGTEAWAAFSLAKKSKTVTRDGVDETFSFSTEERKTFRELRQATQKKLFDECRRTCSYCRRPVGHYGFGWHIEHVLPKSKYPSLTFKLSNLTVGCVDCNMWKGRRVDPNVANRVLPIINPLSLNFQYSEHLQYLQLCTESLSFAKYIAKSDLGRDTHSLLSFAELERAEAVNSVDTLAAALHDRLSRAMVAGQSSPQAQDILSLLGDLKLSIYKRP